MDICYNLRHQLHYILLTSVVHGLRNHRRSIIAGLEGHMADMLTTVTKGRSALGRYVPRNAAVSRVATAIQEAWSRRRRGRSAEEGVSSN